MAAQLLNIEDFKNSESINSITSASAERKSLCEVVKIDENLRMYCFYRVYHKGEIVLDNSSVEDAVLKYNSIQD